MKRIILAMFLLLCISLTAFSQIRLDAGVAIPFAVGILGDEGVASDSDINEFLAEGMFPFPEVNVYYQFDLGLVKLGAGIRMFTFILETVMWPDLMAEIGIGPLVVQAHLGGLYFAGFGLVSFSDFGQVFIPDISAWLALGKNRTFRLGLGVIGMTSPDTGSDAMLVIPYGGIKVSFVFGE